MTDKKILKKIAGDTYLADDGSVLQREYGNTSSGNPINNKWVYRNNVGAFIDYSLWRNDLAEKHSLYLE